MKGAAIFGRDGSNEWAIMAPLDRKLFKAPDCGSEAEVSTRSGIREIMMQDLVGDYDVPDDVPEWAWVEKHASFGHVRNGQNGIWEFILNLSLTFHDVPERIAPAIKKTASDGVAYLVFHQGT